MNSDALKPIGVSLAELRSSLEFEVAHGRGPDSPARREMERRLAEAEASRRPAYGRKYAR